MELKMNSQQKSQKWLEILNQITSLAQSGLYYSKDAYDQERYTQLITHVGNLLELDSFNAQEFSHNLLQDIGYATPKLDVRAVVFQHDKILLTREVQDGRWSLPGGWADVGYSASENVVKEVLEETGIQVKVTQLLSLLDYRKHPYPAMFLHAYKAFFLCEVIGGELRASLETSESGYFSIDELPPISEGRVTTAQVKDLFSYIVNPATQTYFD